MDNNCPYEFKGFGAMDGHFAYEFIGFGTMDGHVAWGFGPWMAILPMSS